MLRRYQMYFAAAALALTLSACGVYEQSAETIDGGEPAAEQQSPAGTTEVDPDAEFCAEVGRRVSVEDCEDLSRLADEASRGTAAFNAPNPMQRGDVHTLQLAISTEPPAPAPPPPEAAPSQPGDDRNAEPPATTSTESVTELREELRDVETELAAAPEEARANELRARRAELREQIVERSPPRPAQVPEDVVDPLQGETVEFTPLVGRYMRAELSGNGFEITPLTEPSQEVLEDSVTTWSWRVEAREGGQRTLTLRTVVEGCTAQGQCYPLRSTSQNYDVTVQVGPLGQVRDFLMAAPDWLRLLAGVLTALAVLVGAWFGLRNAFRKGTAATPTQPPSS